MAWSPARFDLATFTQVQVLGLTATDDALKGFNGLRCFAQSMTQVSPTTKS